MALRFPSRAALSTRSGLAALTLCTAFIGIGDRHGAGAPAAAPLIPADITALRSPGDVQLSPDGARVAFTISDPGDREAPRSRQRSHVWVVAAQGRGEPRRVTARPAEEWSPRWSPDGRQLAFLAGEDEGKGPGGPQILCVPAIGGEPQRVTEIPQGVQTFRWSRDSRMIAFTASEPTSEADRERLARGDDAVDADGRQAPTRLWTVTIATRAATMISKHLAQVYDFAWSPDGSELAVVAAPSPSPEDDLNLALVVVRRQDGAIVRTLSPHVGLVGALRWSPDGRLITFLEGSGEYRFASWLEVVPAAGGPAHASSRDSLETVLAAEWMPDSKRLVTQVMKGTKQFLALTDVASGKTHVVADLMMSQWNFGISTDGERVAYLCQQPGSPDDVWLVELRGGARRLTDLNPQTRSWRLGSVSEMEWTNTKDGLLRRGVLIRPPGFRTGKSYPTIVVAHPGDTAWWIGWHGAWWAWGQLLASNGYVVFLPNTRGVTGEGWKLHQTIGDWGGMAFRDLMDGVDALVARGIADPERLGIGGWSNGGFMTEWAITHTTRFKAAVAQAGHSDFFALYGTSPMRASLRACFGVSAFQDRVPYDTHSPITYVRECRTPTLLLHGENDRGVPPAQAKTFFTALRDLGVEAELVIYPREGHGIQERAHREDVQRRVLAWFNKHLLRESPGPAAN